MNCANHPDRERVAFCQNCGKPLCQECTRVVGSAVFCEPCLAAKLAGTTPNPSSYSYNSGSYDSSTANANANYIVDSVVPPPTIPGAPSPALATILGFIPGVGAMYNGQYAKGVVHLIVFAILVSLASDVNGIFGLFIAGWIVYQAIEANHTARAKLAGTPLPNPFGLNDLGERFGFGKSWTVPGAAPVDPAAPTASPFTPPAAAPYPAYTPPATHWGSPAEAYNYATPPVPPMPPYGASYVPVDPNLPNADFNQNGNSTNRFPAGAFWLIALGIFFLIGNTHIFHGLRFQRIFPLCLIGLGIWLFIRKMTETGTSLADDGTPMYRIRVFRALRGSVWVMLVGVVFFLAFYDIVSWSHSWPLFIIVAGLMTLLERAAYATAPAGYPYAPVPAGPPASSTASAPMTSTAIVPGNHNHDQEGN
jgi:hypothetical protein